MKNFLYSVMGRPYRYSKYKSIYEDLAKRYDVVPGLVYLVAHGKAICSLVECHIEESLYSHKVVRSN